MYGFMLQDWTTIRGVAGTTSTIIQSEKDWLSLQPYQDIAFWIEVREFTPATTGGSNVTFDLQTAPMKDESLFVNMISPSITVTGASAGPVTPIPRALLASASVPLARWLRWKLTANGTAGVWDVTFRIGAAANAVARLG